ncbi:MAG: ribosome small subunit-dependent GTPase A [Legionellaceae bacterium]|nr:ribosome small subunit-dependent GTPase A [Legionellaceae bacterium]
MSHDTSLTGLGWQPFFQQQCSSTELTETIPARIIELYGTEIAVATASDIYKITLLSAMPEMVVGDWILLDEHQQFLRLLQRKTCFSRKAAGHKLKKQLISANMDVAFIVSSMNEDFNLNRIERFLSLVHASGAEPVVLLSKSDQTKAPDTFVSSVQMLDSNLNVKAVNCLDVDNQLKLSAWLKNGMTVVMLGSSGVGKSTLTNTLLGENRQTTGAIRDHDQKGHHTTTRRSLITLERGGLILDTPGIREIQLVDCKKGIAMTFSDIGYYASQCRFNNCQHQVEPGCAVQAAVKSGDLDKRRLMNYLKLLEEEALNSSKLSQLRVRKKR